MSKGKNKLKKTSKKTSKAKVGSVPSNTANQPKADKPEAVEKVADKDLKSSSNLKQANSGKNKTSSSLWNNAEFKRKFFTIFWSMIGFITVILTVFIGFPALFDQTEAAQDYREEQDNIARLEKEREERRKQEEEENPIIAGNNRQVKLVTNFGDIVVETQTEAAPKSVENFLRLTYRGYYDQTTFHRMVEKDDFAVIQGGDPTGSGAGGESAFGPEETIPDELWAVEPEFETNEAGETVLSNEPKLQGNNLYQDFSTETGLVTYPKGSVVMAKTNAPDSATSQFFIVLSDTVLPAQYTIFALVQEESLSVLDKILNEVDPAPEATVDGTMGDPDDGKPIQEILLEKAELILA